MEQIKRREGKYFYGEQRCEDADDAYVRLRNEYHRGLGKAVYRRLDRLGLRSERIHGYGFDYPPGEKLSGEPYGYSGARYRILGIIGLSYSRMVGLWDMPGFDEGKLEGWLEWAFSRGSGALHLIDRKSGVGRTAKKKRFRNR